MINLKHGKTINDEERANIELTEGQEITYEIVVQNTGNITLTEVAVTDDHDVTVQKIEKEENGNRIEDATLKQNSTKMKCSLDSTIMCCYNTLKQHDNELFKSE